MNKLRKTYVIAVFLSAAVVFALTSFFMFLGVRYNNIAKQDEMTRVILENGGQLGDVIRPGADRQNRFFLFDYNEESQYRLRFFIVEFENGLPVSADVSHIASVDADGARGLAGLVVNGLRHTGYHDEFRFRVSEDRQTVIFLDCSDDLDTLKSLVLMISLISLLFVMLITVVFYFLSKRIMRPFEENARMQKRFITDASHELKTPLAIISANAEVLAYKEGENEWINNILTQVDRSTGLINELLTLNRLEEIETNTELSPVDMSAVTREVADEFFGMFRSKNVGVEYDITEGATVLGQPEQLRRLVSVLVENASKYVSENGSFKLSLKKNQRNIELKVFNTCKLDPDADYKHLFDRFFRPDSSRASGTGGHGVGLSIAKRIVDLHSGSIEAAPEKDGICFRAVIPNRRKGR